MAFGVSLVTLAAWLAPLKSQTAGLANPILFVTQVPIPADFATVASVFGNHVPSMENAGRGGDLWIAYPDGTLKNLTQAAGFGNAGQQGVQSIAVREPSVHWSGSKALFSMAVGAPVQFEVKTFYWQIYEITGLGQNQQPAIRKITGQPENFNNVSPFYGTDERILFTSDRPRNGAAHLYPQLDEYELAPTNTGIWSLDPATGDLFLLDHAPSGVFTPIIDSFGRVVFTRWDHLQRDQEADIDALNGSNTYGTFNFSSEAADAARLNTNQELFPEPRSDRKDLLAGTNLVGHRMNQFFPWQIHEDGTEAETLNHVGRHELLSYFDRSLTDDGNLTEFIAQRLDATNVLQLKEEIGRASCRDRV